MSLIDVYHNIKTIYDDPLSYQKVDQSEDSIQDDSITIIKKIIEKVKSIDRIDENTNNTLILFIKNILNLSLPKYNFDYTGFIEYIDELSKQKQVCNKFKTDPKLMESFSDDDTNIYAINIFKCMQCKNCSNFEEEHIVCNKYYNIKKSWCGDCNDCGFSKYKHKTCDDFLSTNDTNSCENCGKDLFDHQQHYKEIGKNHCCNFNRSSSKLFDCKNCIFSELEHKINPKLNDMNKDAYSKFQDEVFKFNVKFLNLSYDDKIKYTDYLTKVNEMAYNNFSFFK